MRVDQFADYSSWKSMIRVHDVNQSLDCPLFDNTAMANPPRAVDQWNMRVDKMEGRNLLNTVHDELS